MSRLFDIGKIVNTHGVRGEVRVQRITDFEERFTAGEKVYLEISSGNILELEIDGHRLHKQFDLLHFKGLNNINDVESFKGKMLKIKEEQQTPLKEGEYYYHQIIDCEVYTVSGEFVGKVTSILKTGANDVWEVKSPKGQEFLIPFIQDVVKTIDINTKKIIIEPMEGLLE